MEAFNNGYPVSYPQMYYPQQYQQQNQQNSSIIWVQGEAGAKSYLVAPNNTVQLWDSESQTIYLKSADASGMPSMKILDYTIRGAVQNTPAVMGTEYATKADVEELRMNLAELRKSIEKETA